MGSPLLVVLLLVGVAVGVGRLLVAGRQVDHYLSRRDTDAAHVVMNLGMAWMASTWCGQASRSLLFGVFSLLAAVFAVRLLFGLVRPTARRRAGRGAEIYHLLAAGAMAWATVLMPAMTAGHVDMTNTMTDGSTGRPWAAVVLAVVFGADALITVLLVTFLPDRVLVESARHAPQAPPAPPGAAARAGALTATATGAPTTVGPDLAARRTLRIAAVPHVIMGVGMVWMLLSL